MRNYILRLVDKNSGELLSSRSFENVEDAISEFSINCESVTDNVTVTLEY